MFANHIRGAVTLLAIHALNFMLQIITYCQRKVHDVIIRNIAQYNRVD